MLLVDPSCRIMNWDRYNYPTEHKTYHLRGTGCNLDDTIVSNKNISRGNFSFISKYESEFTLEAELGQE